MNKKYDDDLLTEAGEALGLGVEFVDDKQVKTHDDYEKNSINATFDESTSEDILIELNDIINQTKRLKTINIHSNFKQALTDLVDPLLKQGYELKKPLPEKPDENNGKIIIFLTHKTQTINRKKVVVQTINYSMSDDTKAPKSVKRELTFSQQGVKDLVTNQITWDENEQTKTFNELQNPKVRGYVADELSVPEQTITVNNDNFNLSLDKAWIINYLPEVLSIKIQIIDDDQGNIIKDYVMNGHDGETHAITLADLASEFKKKHYLISRSNLPEKLIFKIGQSPVYKLHLTHERGNLNDDTLKTEGSYTIKLVDKYEHELRKPIVLVQHYERTAQKDYVTGRIDYEPWHKVNHLPESEFLPEKLTNDKNESLIPMANKYTIPEIAPNTNEDVEAIYFAPKQVVNLHFRQNDKIVTDLKLHFNLREDQHVNLFDLKDNLAKSGYRILDDQKAPLEYKYDASLDDNRTYDINVQAIIKNDIESKIVKRTIIIKMPNGAKRSIIQNALLTRDLTIDLSNNQRTYGTWSTNLWDEYHPSNVTGFVPNQLTVEQVLVNGDTKDVKVKIHYIPYNAPQKPVKQTFFQKLKAYFEPDAEKLQIEAPQDENKNQ